MKNDVVRWSAPHTSNESNFNALSAIRNCAVLRERVDVCVSVTASTPPPAPATTHHERISPAPTIRVPAERPLVAFTAINCDTSKFEKSSPLVHESVRSSQNSFICVRDLFVEVLGFVRSLPTSEFAESCTATFFHRPSRHSSLRRTRSSWSLTKVRLNFLRIICIVVLCNISVGVAADWPPNKLDYHEGDVGPSEGSEGHYTPTWAVHIPNGDEMADEVARDHGFVNLGKIFDDHYHFAHHKVSKRSLSPASFHQTRLDEDDRVHWARQQKAKSRSKRDFIRMRPSRTSSRALSLVDAVPFSDPKWPQMWYLNRGGGLDMNVIPAWKEGITGKGIVVTILDDGLESDHPDIEHNYDPKASYDVNSHDDNPMPTYDMTDSNRHGTRCAGEVAATANNSICAVGIAYGASVGGVRMLDGDVTDAVEARSLSLNPQHIDIYSASWGPDDDGKTVDGPGELASRAFIEGVTKGRSGKGSIFIWASGNGGRELDNCNCDGYTNSIWTLSISSATEEGNVPWYSEKCSSTLATTYSSGAQNEKQVVTTDLHHSCTVSHTGTSASAPLAAGIAALVLESNQNLTWRDLQHIVVRTAKPANLRDPTWTKNGVGRRISHSFGYGLMDAAGMVRVARTWKTVPEQHRCEINAPHVDKVIPPKGYITLQQKVKHCSSVNYLEHVQAKITLTSQRRGDIQLYLKSPAGTKVTLLTSRIHDVSRSGFNQWPFMSVHTWGESPQGNWQLEIHNEGRFMGHAVLREWSLILYGTTHPISVNDPKSTPRATSSEYTTPNTSSMATTTNLHQFYSEQYPRISPNNFGVLGGVGGGGGALGSGKLSPKFPPNKTVYMGLGPAMSVAGSGNFKKQQQKQQSYQGILDNFDAILVSQPKNKSKTNGKGKPGELKGNKNNSNGKISSNKKDPSSSSATTPNSSKNKFYRLSNGKTNKSPQVASTSQRPKLPAFQSSERLQNHQEMQGPRKVIGDLFPMSNEKIPEKNTSPQTTSYSKLPGKAIKQIKESQTVLQSHEKLTSNDQRIPKMFERYEKIQAIFPEFQPYQGARDFGVSGSTPSDRQQFQANEAAADLSTDASVSTSSLRPVGFNGGSKPSRGNSKKSSQSFAQEQRQHVEPKEQNRLLTVATTANGRNVESVTASQRPIEAVANRQPINAQITQWDLIFHGTEIPAQPGDPVHISTGHFNAFGNEMDQNHLEFDPDTANGQWRNVEQVGESSLMTGDRTNTACLKATINQRCLACAFPTVIFEGRCYQECPSHTFAEWDTSIKDLEENSFNAVNSDQNEVLMSTDRKRALLVASHEQQFNAERRCAACHRSCLRCYGALNSQCSTCFPGSQLRKSLLSNDTYCYVFAERSSGNIQDGSPNSAIQGTQNRLFLMIIVPSVVVISCLVLLNTTLSKKTLGSWRRWGAKDGATYSYDRVALLPEAEAELEGESPEVAEVASTPAQVQVEEEQEEKAIEQQLHPNVIVEYVSEVESDSE